MSDDDEKFKRINVLMRPEQHKRVHRAGLSLSGLVRDLLDDRFSETTITISVSEDTKHLYDKIISNYGLTDDEVEHYFREALSHALAERAASIAELQKKLEEE